MTIATRRDQVLPLQVHRRAQHRPLMAEHRHQCLALVGRPHADASSRRPVEHDRVVRVLDEARRLASVRVACAHRDSRRHVQPSHVARLTATNQQVVVRQELELPWRADAAQTVQLRPLAVVDVQVLRLG